MLLTTLLLSAQATPDLPNADTASPYSNRDMASYTAQPSMVSPSCVRKFRRLKVPRVSVDILLDLNESGDVSMARIDGESRDQELGQCVLNWVKTLRFKSDSPRRGVYVSTLLNASLIPPPPKYVQYEVDDAATIHNWGSAFSLCRLTGLAGTKHRFACFAYVGMIDGHVAKWNGSKNHIAPGMHQIMVSCSTQTLFLADLGGGSPFVLTQMHTYSLESGGSYKLEPRWDGDLCVVDIIDQKNGLRLEKLEQVNP